MKMSDSILKIMASIYRIQKIDILMIKIENEQDNLFFFLEIRLKKFYIDSRGQCTL